MRQMIRIRMIPLCVLAFATACPSAFAQVPVDQLAEFSGSLHVAARACNLYSEDQLAKMKREEWALHLKSGMDLSGYDKAFSRGQEKARTDWRSMSQVERTDACKEWMELMKQRPTVGAKR